MYLFVCFCFVYQATAEQIRLAQMIYDKNDADFEDKVKQVMCLCISRQMYFLDDQPIFLELSDIGTVNALHHMVI